MGWLHVGYQQGDSGKGGVAVAAHESEETCATNEEFVLKMLKCLHKLTSYVNSHLLQTRHANIYNS